MTWLWVFIANSVSSTIPHPPSVPGSIPAAEQVHIEDPEFTGAAGMHHYGGERSRIPQRGGKAIMELELEFFGIASLLQTWNIAE